MTRIYWKPHKSRKRKREFVEYLETRVEGQVVEERFDLHPGSLDCLLEKSSMLAWLEKDCYLPETKRQRCIDEMQKLPDSIRVAMVPKRISFDLVIQQAGHTFYWEFHEEQHRRLTVNRMASVYGPDGQEYKVPRYLQRFLRDIWRIQTFPNTTIVWFDWFETHQASYEPSLTRGFREYHLQNRFCFGTFCSPK